MKAFAELFSALDETTKTTGKVEAMVDYFRVADERDAAWAVYFLSGRKPRQVVPARKLAAWATEKADVAEWLFEECYHAVGDMAETITLMLPPSGQVSNAPLHVWIETRTLPLRALNEAAQREAVRQAWSELSRGQVFVWNKLITGAFRVGVSQLLVTRALAQVSGIDAKVIAHRLMGEWQPTPAFYRMIIAAENDDTDRGKPYPFCLAHPLEVEPAQLGPLEEWRAEWKWDGIRAQLIRRGGEVFLWSRGEELVTDRYPEIRELAKYLPDGIVLDGELLPWKSGAVLPFAQLQRRIGRKTIGKKLLDEVPVILMVYDLLEVNGRDCRDDPFVQRRAELEALVSASSDPRLQISAQVNALSWEELALIREQARGRQVEGLMLKRANSAYRVGRVRGDWWKWKVAPYTIDAVLIYAQRGSGIRASLYTDYTFGIWDGEQLVPIAKAYSGLTNEEIRVVDAFIRKNTTEKFGPVRTVKPELVFELAFEAIQLSSRHKSGIAVRFPRILRQRTDKVAAQADTLEQVRSMLKPGEPEQLEE